MKDFDTLVSDSLKMGDQPKSQTYSGTVITSRLSTTKSITSAVTVLIVCVGLFFWLNSLGLRMIRSVKGGHPMEYPNITYEEAFSHFYSGSVWENASSGNTKIVRFTGNCSYDGKPAKIVLNYWVDESGSSFRLHDGTINGTTANFLELNALDQTPFREYKK